MIRYLAASCLALLFTGWIGSEPSAGQERVDDVRRAVLPNGMVVLTKERADPDTVAISVAVRAGSRDEDDVTNGAAHFMEHMFFQGTPSRPSALDVDWPIASRGGRLNATTGWETIQFDAVVRAADFPVAVDVLADMLTNSTFEPAAVEKERRVVLQEFNARMNTPRTRGTDQFFQALLADHPARHLPGGSQETVLTISRDTLLAFRERWFVANNMVVAVVGNVPHEAAVATLAPAFRDLPVVSLPERLPVATAAMAEPIGIRVGAGTHQAQVLVGVRAPSLADPDRPALAVLDAVVDGAGRRLFTEIRDRRGLAYSVGSGIVSLSDTGVWYATAGVDPENVELVTELIVEEMRRLRDEPLTPAELDEAKSYLEGRAMLALEANLGQARRYASQEALGVREPIGEYVARVRAVTANDVQRVARRYLDLTNYVRLVVEPEQAAGGREPAPPPLPTAAD
jgi:predicted Zn-dependent peptidase